MRREKRLRREWNGNHNELNWFNGSNELYKHQLDERRNWNWEFYLLAVLASGASLIPKFSLNWLNRELTTTQHCWLSTESRKTLPSLLENCNSLQPIFSNHLRLCHNIVCHLLLYRISLPSFIRKIIRKWDGRTQKSFHLPSTAFITWTIC